MAERYFMVQLEERLHADPSGELHASLIRQLDALRDDLIVKRRQVQRPEVYRDMQAALSAVDGALDALKTLRIRWEAS